MEDLTLMLHSIAFTIDLSFNLTDSTPTGLTFNLTTSTHTDLTTSLITSTPIDLTTFTIGKLKAGA